MSEWKFIQIDTWWKAVFYLGVLSAVGSLLFQIDFIERKHLFGLGLGMIPIGLGFWKAWKSFSQFTLGGILKWKDHKHDAISILLIIIGSIFNRSFGLFDYKRINIKIWDNYDLKFPLNKTSFTPKTALQTQPLKG